MSSRARKLGSKSLEQRQTRIGKQSLRIYYLVNFRQYVAVKICIDPRYVTAILQDKILIRYAHTSSDKPWLYWHVTNRKDLFAFVLQTIKFGLEK